MTALVVVAAFVVVVGLAAWTRRASVRAERRSVQSYGRALGVLGDVSRRSDRHAVPPVQEEKEIGRPHVVAGDADHLRPASASAASDVPPPRVRLQPPVLPGTSPTDPPSRLNEAPSGIPRDDDTVAVPAIAAEAPELVARAENLGSGVAGRGPERAEPARPVLFDDASETTDVPRKARREMRHLAPGREHLARRAATGAAAAVVIGALAVGGYELASSRSPKGASSTTPPTTPTTLARHGSGASPTPSSTSTTTAPARHANGKAGIQPTSVSSSVVSFAVPSSTYTITLTASSAGACWVGVQPSVSGGGYLWMDTVQAGQSATYKATGSVAIRVGNPRVLSVEVNGEKIDLPPGRVQVYDVALTPAQASA